MTLFPSLKILFAFTVSINEEGYSIRAAALWGFIDLTKRVVFIVSLGLCTELLLLIECTSNQTS